MDLCVEKQPSLLCTAVSVLRYCFMSFQPILFKKLPLAATSAPKLGCRACWGNGQWKQLSSTTFWQPYLETEKDALSKAEKVFSWYQIQLLGWGLAPADITYYVSRTVVLKFFCTRTHFFEWCHEMLTSLPILACKLEAIEGDMVPVSWSLPITSSLWTTA